jgi:hypothetical protein
MWRGGHQYIAARMWHGKNIVRQKDGGARKLFGAKVTRQEYGLARKN